MDWGKKGDMLPTALRPIEDLPREEAESLAGLLFDLDDTLLDSGRLGEAAYSALFRLQEAGLDLLAVTGRPAGWGAVLAGQWPVVAVVAENGALSSFRCKGRVETLDPVLPAERRARRIRLAEFAEQLLRRYPFLCPADDQSARVSDFTFDIGERASVPRELVVRIQEFCEREGYRTVASSVHLHVSLDGEDKASGTLRTLWHTLHIDPESARRRYAFIGDSENDASCFAAFATSIAVQNLTGAPSVLPRYITRQPRGMGFAEAARILVERRAGIQRPSRQR